MGVLLAFLFAAVPLRAAEVAAKLVGATGAVEVSLPGSSSFAPAKPGMALPVGTSVRTGAEGAAVVATTPSAAIRLDPGSVAKLGRLDYAAASDGTTRRRRVRIELEVGAVSALIDHTAPDVTDFVVKTPQGSAAARGTFYAVLIRNGKTSVGVAEGRVEVSGGGSVLMRRETGVVSTDGETLSTTADPAAAAKWRAAHLNPDIRRQLASAAGLP